jgi:serine/threonine protein phosphatase PrpC
MYLRVAASTDVGRVRKGNEDAFVVANLDEDAPATVSGARRIAVGERGMLLAVSDGMGGARAGEVASKIVVDTLRGALAEAAPAASRRVVLTAAVERAHRAVQEAAREDKKFRGMGATLTAVFVRGNSAYIAEVGDSRAYLLRRGVMKQLTKDQSLTQMLIDKGALDPARADESPLKNVILQAMGRSKRIKVALARLSLRAKDCLLLCSDGLTRYVSDEEIRDIVLPAQRLDAACKALVDLANERGGADNITVMLAGVGGTLEAARSTDRITRTFEVLASYEEDVPSRRAPRSKK